MQHHHHWYSIEALYYNVARHRSTNNTSTGVSVASAPVSFVDVVDDDGVVVVDVDVGINGVDDDEGNNRVIVGIIPCSTSICACAHVTTTNNGYIYVTPLYHWRRR
jgi:hypothetical protein